MKGLEWVYPVSTTSVRLCLNYIVKSSWKILTSRRRMNLRYLKVVDPKVKQTRRIRALFILSSNLIYIISINYKSRNAPKKNSNLSEKTTLRDAVDKTTQSVRMHFWWSVFVHCANRLYSYLLCERIGKYHTYNRVYNNVCRIILMKKTPNFFSCF